MKPLRWMARTREEVRQFPGKVCQAIGYALHFAQMGDKHPSAKPLQGFGGAGVLEVVEDHDGNRSRAVYTVKLAEVVYVLHVFQRKAKRRLATPKQDIELVRQRLRAAERHYRETMERKR